MKIHEKEVSKNGMLIKWNIKSSEVIFKIFAPTNGWLAIGINTKEGLKGTNLIMGHVKNSKAYVEDQYIIEAGNHKRITSLGGQSMIKSYSGKENTTGTNLSISIPKDYKDKYHHSLKRGNEYYLLMAYSQEDDFGHHSIMRTSIKIIL